MNLERKCRLALKNNMSIISGSGIRSENTGNRFLILQPMTNELLKGMMSCDASIINSLALSYDCYAAPYIISGLKKTYIRIEKDENVYFSDYPTYFIVKELLDESVARPYLDMRFEPYNSNYARIFGRFKYEYFSGKDVKKFLDDANYMK